MNDNIDDNKDSFVQGANPFGEHDNDDDGDDGLTTTTTDTASLPDNNNQNNNDDVVLVPEVNPPVVVFSTPRDTRTTDTLHDIWGEHCANPEARAAWYQAHQAGVDTLHKDSANTRHTAWIQALGRSSGNLIGNRSENS
jgi:hypothetical protein